LSFPTKCEPPRPLPTLDPFFAQDRLIVRWMTFIPDQSVDAPPARLAIELTALMLIDPSNEVVGHSNLQPAARPVRQDVNPVLAIARARLPDNLCEISGRASALNGSSRLFASLRPG
jgi:hypothetical protein